MLGTKNPFIIYSEIYSLIIDFILFFDVAFDIKNCLFAFVNNLDCFVKDFYHFHPKFVSWSPASTNCSGVNTPFY